MVSRAASMPAYAARFIDTKDITMMHSVIDIDGLNGLSKSVLERAAGLPPLVFADDAFGSLRGIEGSALSGLAAGRTLVDLLQNND